LIQRKEDSPPDAVSKLPDPDRALFLRQSAHFNYQSTEVVRWMLKNALARKPDEDEVDFARRVFQFVVRNFQYEYLGEQNRSASNVCTTGKSDCGGLAVLFCTVMRSQGIPARTLAGRWANSAKPDEKIGRVSYFQEHVKAEFFAQNVGWVPVDLSSAVLHDRSAEKLAYFGNDRGDFLTLHLDNDHAARHRSLRSPPHHAASTPVLLGHGTRQHGQGGGQRIVGCHRTLNGTLTNRAARVSIRNPGAGRDHK
jgi:transglutaminase-like putative cysteine protease